MAVNAGTGVSNTLAYALPVAFAALYQAATWSTILPLDCTHVRAL